MEGLRKKLIIVIVLACGILAYSFYNFVRKSSDSYASNTVSPAASVSTTATNNINNGNSSEVVIYVSGAVNKPGVYKLASGSRVVDAVTIAGGFAPGADAAKINLALQVKDEMQVNVPYTVSVVTNNTGAQAGSGVSGGSHDSDKININTASPADLDKLPGIGAALAERIVEYRNANGLFKDTADIKKFPE